MTQTVDPAVSMAKFRREVGRLRRGLPDYSGFGWWLRKAVFPIVEIGFVAVNASPPLVLVIARFDFTDYDAKPLSVTFHDAKTGAILPKERMHTKLEKLQIIDAAALGAGDVAAAPGQVNVERVELIQGVPGQPAFLCLPGVRQYHDNPAHSGDPWELRRTAGEGSLLQLAHKICQYGVTPVHGVEIVTNLRPAFQLELQP